MGGCLNHGPFLGVHIRGGIDIDVGIDADSYTYKICIYIYIYTWVVVKMMVSFLAPHYNAAPSI